MVCSKYRTALPLETGLLLELSADVPGGVSGEIAPSAAGTAGYSFLNAAKIQS